MPLLHSDICFVVKGVFSRATSSIIPFELRIKPVASTMAGLLEVVVNSALLRLRYAEKSRISDHVEFKFND